MTTTLKRSQKPIDYFYLLFPPHWDILDGAPAPVLGRKGWFARIAELPTALTGHLYTTGLKDCIRLASPDPPEVWPVKLLKTRRGKARPAGWAGCRAGWGWRSVRGCIRFSGNRASETPGLGSAERRSLWTPAERKPNGWTLFTDLGFTCRPMGVQDFKQNVHDQTFCEISVLTWETEEMSYLSQQWEFQSIQYIPREKTFTLLFFFNDFSKPGNKHLKIPGLFQVFHDNTNPAESYIYVRTCTYYIYKNGVSKELKYWYIILN